MYMGTLNKTQTFYPEHEHIFADYARPIKAFSFILRQTKSALIWAQRSKLKANSFICFTFWPLGELF